MAKKSDSPSSKKASGKQTDAAAASAQKVVAKQRGLGRGLSSLLGDAGAAATMTSAAASAGAMPAAAAPQSGLVDIPIEWINSGPWQPRRRFDIAALEELADSIRSKGLVQPVLVRPHNSKTNRYELIAGERRWRAAQMAQLHNVPAIIRDFSDEEAYEVALIENVQRADLNVIEEADGYRQLIENFGYTQGKMSEITSQWSDNESARGEWFFTITAEVNEVCLIGFEPTCDDGEDYDITWTAVVFELSMEPVLNIGDPTTE